MSEDKGPCTLLDFGLNYLVMGFIDLAVITAYLPEEHEWSSDFRTRRQA